MSHWVCPLKNLTLIYQYHPNAHVTNTQETRSRLPTKASIALANWPVRRRSAVFNTSAKLTTIATTINTYNNMIGYRATGNIAAIINCIVCIYFCFCFLAVLLRLRIAACIFRKCTVFSNFSCSVWKMENIWIDFQRGF